MWGSLTYNGVDLLWRSPSVQHGRGDDVREVLVVARAVRGPTSDTLLTLEGWLGQARGRHGVTPTRVEILANQGET